VPRPLPPAEGEEVVRIKVDFKLCRGHGVCMGEAPEVFKVREDGTLVELLQECPPDHLREKIESAAKYCPTGAISIE
jgi:ferredoxin